MATPVLKGSYALLLRLERDRPLTVGRLGTFAFPAGLYLYAGSALNGLESRVRRHLRRDENKKRHWHIDYLTALAPICQVWWTADGQRRECEWAGLTREGGGQMIAPGFGSSDCRCSTHLLSLGLAGMDGTNAAALTQLRAALLNGLPAGTARGVFRADIAGAFVLFPGIRPSTGSG